MRRTLMLSFSRISFLLCCVAPLAAVAQVPLEQIVPASAKGFFSVPNVDQLEANWQRTAVSKLFDDEAFRPFVEDLTAQVDSRLDDMGIQIGITVDDLRDVCSHEAAIAFLQPDDPNQRHAMLVIMDATGNVEKLEALIARMQASMERRKATSREATIGEVPVTIYTVPVKEGPRPTVETVIFRYEDLLIATDHISVAQQVVPNLTHPSTNALADVPAFQKTMQRCLAESNGQIPDIRWYVEPLGYAEIVRDFSIRKKRRRTDVLRALRNQGFDAIQGIGGVINLAVQDHEFIGHAYGYAPPVREAGENKYEKAAGLLAYPIVDTLEAQDWIPNHVSSFVSARWGIQQAFDHVGMLVDEIAGEPGFFEDLIDSLKNDPNGPRIDLRKEIVAFLGNRVTVITNTTEPITVTSERLLIAIELIDAGSMKASLEKMLGNDPVAQRIDYNDHVIWEIVPDEADPSAVTVEGLEGFGDMEGFGGSDEEDSENDEEPFLSHAALSVVKGHLMISSHADFITEMIDGTAQSDPLKKDEDYQAIGNALAALRQRDAGGVLFSRIDRELKASYELVRRGKMPESEGLIGRLLNRALGSNERGVIRKQEINGEKMPEFEAVQKYLGPIGMYVRTEEEGWYLGALGLKAHREMHGSRPPLTTAAAGGPGVGN